MALKANEIIKVENLSKYYLPSHRGDKKQYKVLDNINFTLHESENLGIIGTNGSGKSTLLKILAGITYPSEGKISYKGKISALLEVGAGFHQELTGYENIMMAGGVLGMRTAEIKKKLNKISEFTELEEKLAQPLFTYSTGMKLRLGFAVAAFLDSNIMLIDEALAVGDYNFQQKCLTKINKSREEGKTFIIVSHNSNLIKSYCDSTLYLNNGIQKYFGNSITAISNYLNSNSRKVNITHKELLYTGYSVENDIFLIENISISSQIQIENKFSSNDFVFIQLEIYAKKKMNNPLLFFTLEDSEGNYVLTSLLNDQYENIEFAEGKNLVKCTLPPNLFGENRYWLSIGIQSSNQNLRIKRVLSFETQFHPYNSFLGFQFSESAIRPKLNWMINES